MPEFTSTAANVAATGLDPFVTAYILAMYWTSTGGEGQPDSEAELSEEGINRAVDDCNDFRKVVGNLLEQAYAIGNYDASKAGHDYWLTRNGHGTGFFDRDELDTTTTTGEDLGVELSRLAQDFTPAELYEGDDELLYIH